MARFMSTHSVRDTISKFFSIRLSVVVLVFCALILPLSPAKAQISEEDAYELIVQVRRHDEVVARTLLGYQVGYSSYYLPIAELGRMIEYYTELDLEGQKVTGWYSQPENEFVVDIANGYYMTSGGEVYDLAPDDAIIKSYGSGFGDIYLKLERLNELFPLDIEFNFLKLQMELATPRKLPYELRIEREERRDQALERLANGNPDYKGYVVKENPYRMISKPAVDIDAQIGRRGSDDSTNGYTNLYGRNDFLGFSADYSARFGIEDGEIEMPDNIRALFTRRAFGNDTMPLGIREVRVGDVGLRTPNLVRGATGGRGVTVSSRPVKRQQNFDEITIDGTGIPGYEIELYRNSELIDFGVVSDTGEYRFENVELFAGNNIFRTVLYGPQGQTEERIEEHTIGGSLLSPGNTEYEAGIVDTTDNLITLDDDDPFVRTLEDVGQNDEGIAYSGSVSHGINRNLTVFATGTNTFSRQGERAYATVGANYGFGNVLGSTEVYQEFGGGNAVDNRLATSLAGWRVNLRTGLYKDFESDRTGFDESARKYDIEGRATKRFATDFGSVGIQVSGDHEKREDDSTRSRYRLSNSLARGGQRYGNTLTAIYQDSDLSSVIGRTNANFRLSRELSSRSLLTYGVYPTFDWQNFTTELRYRPNRELRAGLTYGQSLRDTSDVRIGADVGYDFGTFLGSIDGNWNHDGGVDVVLRASTTLAPFADDGGYMFDSRTKRTHNALRSKVFLDRNLNNVFDGDDEWLADTGLEVDGRELELTNEDGSVSYVQGEQGDYAGVTLDEERLTNPFHRTAAKGYVVLLRPGVAQDVEIPVVETGVIDGSAYFENGNPIPGLKMQLVSGHGEVIEETMTSYDGFFVFEFIKPGTYIVRADPQLDVAVPPRTVIVSPDALFAYGVNVNMQEPPKSDIQVEKTQVKQNMASILTNLKKLQSTLSGAVKNDAEPL